MKRILLALALLIAAPCYAGTRDLKEDTAVTIVVGGFVDTAGAAVTAPTIASIDITAYKNDGTAVNITPAASGSSNDMVHTDDGFFSLELTTTDTSTAGYLRLTFQISGALIFHEDFNVLPANIYDSKYASDKLQVDVAEWNGTAVASPATAGYPAVTIKDGTGTGEVDTTSGGVLVAAMAANSVTASAMANDAIDDTTIAADSITSSEIATGAIDAAAIAADAIGASELATDAIGATEIAADAIGASEIATAAIADAEMAATALADDTLALAIKTKTDFLPSATAGSAGGVFIAGTNAATTVTTAFTTTFTGNLTGSIGSVGTNGITANSIDDDAIGSDQIASNAIASAELATAAADEIADSVWDEVLSSGHAVADSAAVRLSDILDDTGTSGVLVSDGTGTGQINTSSGRVEADLTYIMGSALTQNSAGLFATRASDFFASADVASPGALLDALGVYAARVDSAMVLDGAVYQFTANALELGASGSGATAEEVWEYAERELTGGTVELDESAAADIGAEIAENLDLDIGQTVSADVVAASRTWIGKQYRATNIIEVGDNFIGTLALRPDLNPSATINSVDTVSITGAATVTATGLTRSRDHKVAHFTVPTLTTTGTYTVVVTVTTVDGDTIPTTGTLIVR